MMMTHSVCIESAIQRVISNVFDVISNVFDVISNVFDVISSVFDVISSVFDVISSASEKSRFSIQTEKTRSLPAVEMTAGEGRDDCGEGRRRQHRKVAMTALVIPGRAKAEILPPMSFRSEARNLLIPARAKTVNPPPAVISKRSEKSCVAEDASLTARRSLPTVEMTAGEGRDFCAEGREDNRGKSRRQQRKIAMTVLVIPGRAKTVNPPPAVISKRSEKSCVAEKASLTATRSLPAVEMTAGEGRGGSGESRDDCGEGRGDNRGRSRRQQRKVEMTMLVIPDRAKTVQPPPAVISSFSFVISKRSEKSRFPKRPFSPKIMPQTIPQQEIQLSAPQPKQDTIS